MSCFITDSQIVEQKIEDGKSAGRYLPSSILYLRYDIFTGVLALTGGKQLVKFF